MRWAETCLLLLAAGPAWAQPSAWMTKGPAGPVELSQPWALPAPMGGDTSVMFSLHNEGTGRDDLIGAACADAESTELVGPTLPGGQPQRLNAITLQAGQSVTLLPDGVHVVLHHLNDPARVGMTLHCTATFSRSGERLLEADVRPSAPPPAPPI